jgi:hypothetical protein
LQNIPCTCLADSNVLIAGRSETLVEVAFQSFDNVLAIIAVTLQVAEEDLSVLFVSDEFGESQVNHDDGDNDAQIRVVKKVRMCKSLSSLSFKNL